MGLVYAFHGYGIFLYVLITSLIAALLASCIGLERQLRGEAAGVRTHALLAVGSSLLMTISIWAIRMADGSIDIVQGTVSFDLNYDTSRIAAGVVTSIGFLGAGVIIKDKFTVHGLSTASTLWICTAIGLACGAGFISGAIISTLVVMLILIVLSYVVRQVELMSPTIIVTAEPDCPVAKIVRTICEQSGLALREIEITRCDDTCTVAYVRLLNGAKTPLLNYLSGQIKCDERIIDAKPKS